MYFEFWILHISKNSIEKIDKIEKIIMIIN